MSKIRKRIQFSSAFLGIGLFLMSCITEKPKEDFVDKKMPYSYYPEDSVGALKMHVDSWRGLNVAWKNIPLLTEGGQLYSRKYIKKQAKLQTGIHPYNEDDKARDIPVKVIRAKGKIQYIWSCWDYINGVRQTNRATLEKNRVILDSSLQFLKKIPAYVYFHPVLFPGVKTNYKHGSPEEKINDKEFICLGSDGRKSKLKYQKDQKGLWIKNNCRKLSLKLPEVKISFSFSSTMKQFDLNFHTGETWAHDLWTAQRKAIIGSAKFNLNKKMPEFAWRTVIKVDDGNAEKLPLLKVDFPERIQCNADFGRDFAYFYPDEDVRIKLELDNRWSSKQESANLFYEIRNYQNEIIKQASVNELLTAKKESVAELDLGKLPQGAYSVSAIIQNEKQKDLGFICFRLGIVPRLLPYPPEKSFFGSFQAYNANIKTKIELAKYTGVRKVRFRSGTNEETWARFEPQKGKFKEKLIGVPIAEEYAKNNIAMWFHGEQYPPTLFMRVNKFKLPAGLKKNDLVFAYYHSREQKEAFLPKDDAPFVNYVKKLVSNYPMIQTYEVMNEPHSIMDIDFAARTVKLVSQAVKSIYPNAKIQGMAICQLKPDLIEWTEKVLKKVHPCMDTVSFHQYQSRNWFKPNSQSYFAPIESLGWEKQLAAIARVAKKFGKEYCNSEMSWVGCQKELLPDRKFSEQERNSVNMFLRSYMLTKAGGASSVTLCFGTSLRPTFCDYIMSVEKAACLVGLRRMVKPWSVAHANLVDLMDGADYLERIDMNSKEVYNLLFKGRKSLWAAIWNYKNPGFIEHDFKDGDVLFKDPTGAVLPIRKTMPVSGEPLFIVNKSLSDNEFKERLKAMTHIPGQAARISHMHLKNGTNKKLVVFIENLTKTPVKIKSLGYRSGYQNAFKGINDFTLSPGIHSFELPVALASTTKMRIKMELKGEGKAGEFYDSVSEWYSSPYFKTAKRFDAIPVWQAKSAPVIDGDPSDESWNDAEAIILNKKEQIVFDPEVEKNSWNGPEDLSLKARMLWDDKYFYFLAEVKDDIYENNQKSESVAAWAGDAIQIAFDLRNDSKRAYNKDDHEISIALWNGKPVVWRRTFGNEDASSGPLKDAKLAVVRDEVKKTTIYELALPLKDMAPWEGEPLRSKCIKFNFIVNDDDGKTTRRTKWIGITKGIGETKNPELYKNMLFLNKK